ncbi:hypothetical protein [Aquimarina longa]|uniref:hypothetical protein n=1 Tax=Aquimarina longa TaxID=1080221 RepID=UPI000A44DC85|nr:hypothetical protein [Aquimarina longa]
MKTNKNKKILNLDKVRITKLENMQNVVGGIASGTTLFVPKSEKCPLSTLDKPDMIITKTIPIDGGI